MKKIYIGTITSFHGVKGEVRVKSNFKWKEKAFQVGTEIRMDDQNYRITGYRKHKGYELLLLEGYPSLNDVLFLKNKKVYKDIDALSLSEDEILEEELLTYEVLTNEGKRGKIKEIFYASPTNQIMRIIVNEKEYLIPYIKEFVQVNRTKRIVEINWIEW